MPSGSRVRTDTPLGKRIVDCHFRIADVVRYTGIHHRTMTEYVAGRREIQWHHLVRLADFLKCDRDSLQNTPEIIKRCNDLLESQRTEGQAAAEDQGVA